MGEQCYCLKFLPPPQGVTRVTDHIFIQKVVPLVETSRLSQCCNLTLTRSPEVTEVTDENITKKSCSSHQDQQLL